MKCPKCGFVSFDHLDQCKRCGSDLSETREILGFKGLPPYDADPESMLPPAGSESLPLAEFSQDVASEAFVPSPTPEAGEEDTVSIAFDEDVFEDADLGEQLEVGLAEDSDARKDDFDEPLDLEEISLEFEESPLRDMDLQSDKPVAGATPLSPPGDLARSLELDLGEFEIIGPESSAPAAKAPREDMGPTDARIEEPLDYDLGVDRVQEPVRGKEAADTDAELEMVLDEDLELDVDEEELILEEDDPNLKLDTDSELSDDMDLDLEEEPEVPEGKDSDVPVSAKRDALDPAEDMSDDDLFDSIPDLKLDDR